MRSVFFVLPPQWLQPKAVRPVFYRGFTRETNDTHARSD